jgi:hypothetical protein
MRHVMPALLCALTLGLGSRAALATPFEPATIPDRVEAVGHLDADALRKTQLFGAIGGQAVIDDALDDAPPEIRPFARTIAATLRGVSFWKDGERGSVYLETRDARALANAVAKLPIKPAKAVDGIATYTVPENFIRGHRGHQPHHGHLAVYGDTLVLADTLESLERSLRVLAGRAASLSGNTKLPLASRQGVFVFVTIGDDMLSAIQKHAHAKLLQLSLRSLAVDVGESAGLVTASVRAEMRSADAVQKAKSILDGLRALASLSDEAGARKLLDAVTVTSNGLTLEVTARMPAAEVAKAINDHHK